MGVTQLDTDAVTTIRDDLVAGWNAANTQTITPKFTNALWDRTKDYSRALVTITSTAEIPTITGMGPAGVSQQYEGVVDVNCWATPKVFSSGNQGALARLLSWEMSKEVIRIIAGKEIDHQGTFELLHPGSRRPLHDQTEAGVVFRFLVEVNYRWMLQVT